MIFSLLFTWCLKRRGRRYGIQEKLILSCNHWRLKKNKKKTKQKGLSQQTLLWENHSKFSSGWEILDWFWLWGSWNTHVLSYPTLWDTRKHVWPTLINNNRSENNIAPDEHDSVTIYPTFIHPHPAASSICQAEIVFYRVVDLKKKQQLTDDKLLQ